MSKKKSSKKSCGSGARKSQDLRKDESACVGACAAGDPSPSSPGTSSLDEELAWCVSQLELGLQRKGVSKEQKDHNILLIRRLQSEKTPLPKKRALMRTTFGDYRAKMRESPLPQVTVPQFISTQQKGVGSTGRVYRMSTSSAAQGTGREKDALQPIPTGGASADRDIADTSSDGGSTASVHTDIDFKFNFSITQ